jgi:type I restriction enzyme S subunit
MTTTANTAEKTEYKAGYQKTELGWIPEGWKPKYIEDIFKPRNENSNDSEKFPLCSLTIEHGLIDKTERFIREHLLKDKELNQYSLVYPNDILFNPMNLRFGAIARSKMDKIVCVSAYYNVLYLQDDKNDVRFFEYLFKSEKLIDKYDKIAIGSLAEKRRVHLNIFNNIKIFIPEQKEQQKIAEILSCWDESIAKTENLINTKTKLKKSLMAKLLTGKLRFGEFSAEKWKKYKLSDLFERVTRKNTENNTNVLTISAQQGLISQEEFYKKRIASADTSHYLLLKKGEFAYNKSYSTGYPMGAIKKLDRYESGVVSSLYICFAPKSDDICSSFFDHYFEAGLLNNEIQNIAQEGARNHGLLNIGINEFFNTLLKIPPSIEEQKKIAAVLNACDKEIELLNRQLDKLKDQKKGLMQRLLTGQVRVKVQEGAA